MGEIYYGKVILGVTISLDGFAEDIDGSVNKLYPDLDTLRETEVFKESILTTGSVVMSKKEYELADDPDLYAHNYEYQVPIFVFTDKKPEKHPKETDELSFTFITDGVSANLADELERTKLVELPAGRTHIRFKFIK